MAQMNMVEALNKTLDQTMADDERVCLLGQDVGVDGGVFRVTKGLLDKYGEDRVMDTPLAECSIVATAVGMAIYGHLGAEVLWTACGLVGLPLWLLSIALARTHRGLEASRDKISVR